MVTNMCGRAALATLLLALPALGMAEDAEVATTPVQATAARANPLGLRPLDSQNLAASRGGTKVLNDMTLKGTVADNQASHLTTGSNVIGEGAFTNMSGMPMVIQNSGNNVLIQNATIVNVQLK